jgi:hypothetical protein
MKFSTEMRNLSVVCKLVAIMLLAAAVQSCKKRRNDIDNNQIISKPYSLFVADSSGRIENTNDGNQFKVAFGAPGNPVRAMSSSGENLVWVGQIDAFVATNKQLQPGNNLNFNPINQPTSPVAQWQSMILNVPDYNNRIYLAGNTGKGIIYSDSNGKIGTWKVDGSFNPSISGNIAVTSYTQLANGTVLAFDHINTRIFTKTGKDVLWEEVIINDLPKSGKFFISHIENTVVAGDSSGANGIWYSTNNGANWKQYNGLPTGAQVMCMLAPFERVLLVGTAGNGMFRLPLNSDTFEPSDNGLNSVINIRGIAAKNDVYKNGEVSEYVYLATDFGLYRSMDIGKNWILMKPGNYVAIY